MASIRKSQSDRSAETSGKILRAAQKLFALRGFDGVTMRAIASEAGVNLASIVYYFENKEGLYLAVFRQYAEPLMEERMKMLKEADLHPSLRAYARAFIEPAFRLLWIKIWAVRITRACCGGCPRNRNTWEGRFTMNSMLRSSGR